MSRDYKIPEIQPTRSKVLSADTAIMLAGMLKAVLRWDEFCLIARRDL